jgi:hypothetical protein
MQMAFSLTFRELCVPLKLAKVPNIRQVALLDLSYSRPALQLDSHLVRHDA